MNLTALKNRIKKIPFERLFAAVQSKQFIGLSIIVLIFVLFLSGIIIALYFYRFHACLSTEQSVWGAFGDLVGGIFGPTLSFAALIAAFLTIHHQFGEIEKQEEIRRLTVFESSFFNLLHNHSEMVTNFVYYDEQTDVPYQGRKFFVDSTKRIKGLLFGEVKKLLIEKCAENPEMISKEFYQIIIPIYFTTSIYSNLIASKVDAQRLIEKGGSYPFDEFITDFISVLKKESVDLRKQILTQIFDFHRQDLQEKKFDLVLNYYETGFSLESKLQLHDAAYISFYDKFGGEAGYFFRNLRNTLGFIDEKCPLKDEKEKKRYAKLIRAQLSRFEIALLFYNCLSQRSSKVFNNLVSKEKFNMLKGLYPLDLFDFLNYRALLKERNIEITIDNEYLGKR
jgi:hypothetical protein